MVAIGLSCLGIYGLVTFLSEAKEIGVRRVLEPRTDQLLWLLGRGLLVATPVGGLATLQLVAALCLPDFGYWMALSGHAGSDRADHRSPGVESGPYEPRPVSKK